jgi:V-type H+-transporting ATPase subunit E
MEGQVFIRCREEDKDIIESIVDDAVSSYKEMIINQVVRFQGKSVDDIPCKIIIDGKYLESIENNETSGCIGGMKLYAKKGRIVLSQTIDDRVDLCFQAAIPAIRHMLFPSMRRPVKDE